MHQQAQYFCKGFFIASKKYWARQDCLVQVIHCKLASIF